MSAASSATSGPSLDRLIEATLGRIPGLSVGAWNDRVRNIASQAGVEPQAVVDREAELFGSRGEGFVLEDKAA